MTRPDLDAIRARCDAATPGPWTYDETGYVDVGLPRSRSIAVGVEIDATAKSDGDFIANARTDVPALLAYVHDLERELAENDRLRDEICKALEALKTRVPAHLANGGRKMLKARRTAIDDAIHEVRTLERDENASPCPMHAMPLPERVYLVEWQGIAGFIRAVSKDKAKMRAMRSAREGGYWQPGQSLSGLRCTLASYVPPDEPVIESRREP